MHFTSIFIFIVLKQVSTVVAQHCPPLSETSLAVHPGCLWQITSDFRGCRIYEQNCGSIPRCGTNQVWWKCSSNCEPTCNVPHPFCDKSCGPPRCQCAVGFYRNSVGHCVRLNQCQGPTVPLIRCGYNEEYTACSSLCEPTCREQSRVCPLACGPPRCQCRAGYVRDTSGQCLHPSQCPRPTPQCPPNEELVTCSSPCEASCFNQPAACPAICGPPRCQCRQGYARGRTGFCVPRHECFLRAVFDPSMHGAAEKR